MITLTIACSMLFVIALTGISHASNTPTFNQQINAGALITDIRDSTGTSVTSPAVSMSAKLFSFACQTGVNASLGTFGDNNNRIYVDNPSANANFTLTLAPTAGSTAAWNDGGTSNMDFNDAQTGGCDDGGDADTNRGQLTVDPSVGGGAVLTTDCATSCSSTGITQGSQASYVEGTTNSITLINASATDMVWKGYLTGVDLSQTVPAQTPTGSYSLPMTLTVTGS